MFTEAQHGVATDPSRLLRRAGAPRDLIEWTRARPIDELWEECDRGDWLIWLAVVEGVPAVSIVEAATQCARRAVLSIPRGEERKPLAAAIKAAEQLKNSEICARRAAACEAVAGQPEAGGYRVQPSTKLQWAAASAAYAAHAAEGLLSAEARRAAELDAKGRERAAAVGVGDQIISRGSIEPLQFDPDDELIGICISAAESAIACATRALAPTSAEPEALEQVEGELSERVFEILDPVRSGIREGTPAKALVRAISIEPYRATKATLAEAGGELAEQAELSKRAMTAVAAGVVMPIGGAGHHYAGHKTTAWLLTFGGVLSLLGMALAAWPALPWFVIIAADLAMAPGAVARHNNNEMPSPAEQLARGLGALVAAAVVLAVSM